jgi:hypothetical protein
VQQRAERLAARQDFQTFVDKEQAQSNILEARQQRVADAADLRARALPGSEIRDINIAAREGLIDEDQRQASIRGLLRKRALGETVVAELSKADSGQQALFNTVADIEIAGGIFDKLLAIPEERLKRFVGIRGRAGRAVTGITGAATDFLQEFAPEDRAQAEDFLREQFSIASDPAEADEGVIDEIRETGFLLNRELLGSIDAMILGTQIALARSNTRGGRLTRVALDQAKETINANRFSTSESTLAAWRETRQIMNTRSNVITRLLESQLGSKARDVAGALKDEAALLSREPIQVSEDRLRQLEAEDIARGIQSQAEQGLSKDAKSALELFREDMKKIEGEQPRSLRDAAGATQPRRVVRDPRTGEPVRGTGAAAREQGFRPAVSPR